MCPVVHVFCRSQWKSLIPKDGISALLTATSPPVLLLLARMEDTSFNVGGVSLSADIGKVAPVLKTPPPVRVGAAELPLTVVLSSSSATLPFASIAPAVEGETLLETVELRILAAIALP